MGYIAHHSIVVTGMEKDVTEIQLKAIEIFGVDDISPIMMARTNHYFSFFIQPDGSKEGWDESNEGDSLREQFIEYLMKSGSSKGPYCYWVEVRYDENERKEIVR